MLHGFKLDVTIKIKKIEETKLVEQILACKRLLLVYP